MQGADTDHPGPRTGVPHLCGEQGLHISVRAVAFDFAPATQSRLQAAEQQPA